MAQHELSLCFRLELLNPLLGRVHDLGFVKDVCDAVLGADRLAPFAVVGQRIEALQYTLWHHVRLAICVISDHEWGRQSLDVYFTV